MLKAKNIKEGGFTSMKEYKQIQKTC